MITTAQFLAGLAILLSVCGLARRLLRGEDITDTELGRYFQRERDLREPTVTVEVNGRLTLEDADADPVPGAREVGL